MAEYYQCEDCGHHETDVNAISCSVCGGFMTFRGPKENLHRVVPDEDGGL